MGKLALQNSVAYRGSLIINMTANIFFIVSLYYLWKAIFSGSEELAGYSWEEMKAYLLISFLSTTLLSWYSETNISGKIIDGTVAIDLLKPLNFQKARLAETLGTSLFEGGISAVFVTIVSIIFAGVILPSNILTTILFIVSLFSSIFIKFGIVYIAGLICFWTSNSLGIAWGRAAITNFFSGALIPLSFFPNWLENTALYLPFQGIVHTPASIYLGHFQNYGSVIQMVGLQVFWVILLWLFGKAMWNWAVRQVTIHGG
jgi:ABC-2 type transport system permease protein